MNQYRSVSGVGFGIAVTPAGPSRSVKVAAPLDDASQSDKEVAR